MISGERLTTVTEDDISRALEEVLDPEFPVSVVDMGLIRGVEVGGSTVSVKLTYTTLGCPCTEVIQEDIEKRLLALPGIERVEIEEVYEPWSRDDISTKGLQILRTVGLT